MRRPSTHVTVAAAGRPAKSHACQMQPLEERMLLSAGDLDTSFGNQGLLTLVGSDGNAEATNFTVQRGGKVLVSAARRPNFPYATITRYKADGKKDLTFGVKGRIVYADANAEAGVMAIQSDGKVLTSQLIKGKSRLLRYTAKGRPDATFGTKGIAVGAASRIIGIAQSGRRIYVIRYTSGFRLERYLMNGKLDTRFGNRGVVATAFTFDPGSKSYCQALAVQPDGRIVVAGNANEHFAMARYTPSGTLDTTFGDGGKVVTDLPASSEAITTIFLQNDGKILAIGRNMGSHGYTYALARYMPDGSLDTTFGDGGMVDTDVGAKIPAAMQRDGRLVIAGDIDNDNVLIARYNTDGTLDTTFGYGGKVQTELGGREDSRHLYMTGTDGRITLIVRSVRPTRGYVVLVRYMSA